MIPFYRPYYNYLELAAALRPGRARCDLESAVAARAGARYGVAFAYGRVALMAAFKALGLTQAEVILPAYTCMVMGHAVVASGNHPIFVDIDLADYNMDIDALKRALTPRTRAVVATHMYGYPADVDAIRAAVGDERVIIVEDCAQSLHTLSSTGGGLRGDLGLFSFGPGKPISTFEGGILTTNSSDVYEKIKTYRDAEMNHPAFKAQASFPFLVCPAAPASGLPCSSVSALRPVRHAPSNAGRRTGNPGALQTIENAASSISIMARPSRPTGA